MSAKGFLGILISLICLFFIWRHVGPVVVYLCRKRVRHLALEGLSKPKTSIARRLETNGFEFLGWRTESVGVLWRHRSAVFVRENRIVADVPQGSKSQNLYLATFWEDGSCAITRVGTSRQVEDKNYLSRGLSTLRQIKVPNLLAHHYKTEGALGAQGASVPVDSMEKRIELAKQWYQKHSRYELGRPALMGGILSASFLAFWIYSIVLLTN